MPALHGEQSHGMCTCDMRAHVHVHVLVHAHVHVRAHVHVFVHVHDADAACALHARAVHAPRTCHAQATHSPRTAHAHLALRDDQVRVGDDEERRADDGCTQRAEELGDGGRRGEASHADAGARQDAQRPCAEHNRAPLTRLGTLWVIKAATPALTKNVTYEARGKVSI